MNLLPFKPKTAHTLIQELGSAPSSCSLDTAEMTGITSEAFYLH